MSSTGFCLWNIREYAFTKKKVARKKFNNIPLASGDAGIFSGGRPGHLKAITPPPSAGGFEGGSHPDGNEV